MDAFENVARLINLKKINFNQSYGLIKFEKKYKDFVSKKSKNKIQLF